MLDDLDHRRRVEADQATVPVCEGTLDQLHPLPLAGRHRLHVQVATCAFQGPVRDVHGQDPLDVGVAQQAAHQLPAPTTEVRHPPGPAFLDGRHNGD